MMEIEEAVRRILAQVPAAKTETIPSHHACGRVLSVAIHAAVDLPPFDNSAMDGFALRSEEVKSATPQTPVSLQLLGRLAAGANLPCSLSSGGCVRVFTGSPIPTGADAVVMQEDCDYSSPEGTVQVKEAVKPWENIRFRGEDVKQGARLVAAGTRLSASQISLLAATGVGTLLVGARPRVAIIATGDELLECGQPLAGGQIYESNRAGLAAMVANSGGVPVIYPLVQDTLEATRTALELAFSECDLVISSGGVSVGELDFVKAAFQEMGGRLDFWKVSIKPGKPLAFGQFQQKLFFGLPGNPVSAMVGFLVFVAPALARAQGAVETEAPVARGVLSEPISNRGDRPHFVRVKINNRGEVQSTGTQASHILSSLAEANGLVRVPPNTHWLAGEPVTVLRME